MIILANPTFWLLKWLAAGFGSGWLPKAPGTWGSFFALIPASLILQQFGLLGLWWATFLIIIIAFITCYLLLPTLISQGENHDPSWIVIDEWAGQWLCLALLLGFGPKIELNILLPFAFILFRGFDILKPFPIKIIETWGADWFSIINDDLVAGILGAWLGVVLLWAFL